jgi:hypothetical protein
MADGFLSLLGAVVILAVAGLIWTVSATTIANECEKMGVFYVGDRVFECHRKEKSGGGV